MEQSHNPVDFEKISLSSFILGSRNRSFNLTCNLEPQLCAIVEVPEPALVLYILLNKVPRLAIHCKLNSEVYLYAARVNIIKFGLKFASGFCFWISKY